MKSPPPDSQTLYKLRLLLLPFILIILGCGGPTPRAVDSNYVVVLGHRGIMQPGSTVDLPMLLRSKTTNQPVPSANIKVMLGQAPETAQLLFNGTTDFSGTATAKFTVPATLSDPRQFLIITSDRLVGGASAYSRPVYIGRTSNVLVSTDKPVYQPGQTIHARIIGLDSLNLKAAAGQQATLRVQNPDGVTLAQQVITLSDWGIGSYDFALDTRAPTGTYRLVASIGPIESARTLEVKPYTLPRFKIEVNTDKTYYNLESKINGAVQANYFFGKPVANGKVHLEGVSGSAGENVLALEGETDAQGHFSFSVPTPDYFNRSLFVGSDTIDWMATVTDTAEHAEQTSGNILISVDDLKIEAVPESGALRPNLDNVVYWQVSKPDGTAIPATLSVTFGVSGTQPQVLTTDEFGLATMTVNFSEIADVPMAVTATTSDTRATAKLKLGSVGSRTALLLRPERAEYKAGEPITFDYFATDDLKTIYLDVAKNGQSIDFRALDITNGKGRVTLNIAPDSLGTLEVNAYGMGANGAIAQDKRLVLINAAPAQIDVQADAASYQPGGAVKLNVGVSLNGAAMPAALGISIVDESVFAVGAQDPAFVRTYFMLKQELLKPRYNIKGFAPFGPDAPTPNTEDGLTSSAQTALMGALASDLSNSTLNSPLAAPGYPTPTAIPSMPATPTPIASAETNPQSLITNYSVRAFAALPLLGLMLYEPGKKRRKKLLIGLVGFSVLGLVLMGCAAPAAAPAAPAMPAMPAAPAAEAPRIEIGQPAAPGGPIAEASKPRLRQFFPETLLWLPEVVTDANGKAQIDVPLADTITTWRVSVIASGKDGTLGSGTATIKAFQDFFVEPDVPKQLTQNDEFVVPVSVFNYLSEPQQIELTVTGEDNWFQLKLPTQTQTVLVGAGDVVGVKVPIKVTKFGDFNFTVTAKGSKMSDAVRKPVHVEVDGRKVSAVTAGTLAKRAQVIVQLPENRITGTEQVNISVAPANTAGFNLTLPDSFYQDICFYSDVGTIHPIALQMAYLKQTSQLTPEQQLRGERLLQMGYQRLLRYFEYGKGGFTGDCHFLFKGLANAGASANALMALTDLQKLIYVDPLIIERTVQFLANTQQPDGTWQMESDGSYFYFCGPPPQPRDDKLALTTHIAWALSEAGLSNSAPVQRALSYIKEHLKDVSDAHTQALVANTLLLTGNDEQLANRILSSLITRSSLDNGERTWDVQYYNNLDTTATATLALVRSGRKPDEAQQALAGLRRYLGAEQQYYLSQPARPTALRALLLDAQQRADANANTADVALLINEIAAGAIKLNPQANGIAQSVMLPPVQLKTGDNTLQLNVDGDAVLRYRISSAYYVPWLSTNALKDGPFGFEVRYASKDVALNGSVKVTAVIVNQTKNKTAPVIVELGVPAGYYPAYEDLQQMQNAGVLRGFQIDNGKITVNLDGLDAGQKVELSYRVIANVPGSVRIPRSRVYQAITSGDWVEDGTAEMLVTR